MHLRNEVFNYFSYKLGYGMGVLLFFDPRLPGHHLKLKFNAHQRALIGAENNKVGAFINSGN